MNWCATALFAFMIIGALPFSQVTANEDRPGDTVAEDPIAALSKQLSKDPNEIFLWVRDNIQYECYPGSLRGPVGTLWARAGNAWDQSDLLATLLRRAGHRCRIARGQLTEKDAEQLILSMFRPSGAEVDLAKLFSQRPGASELLRRLAQGGEAASAWEELPKAKPQRDPQLLADAADHAWVELSQSGQWLVLDPAFRGTEAGQKRTRALDVFESVPDDRRHTLVVKVEVELGTPQESKTLTLLNRSFSTVELVENPIQLAHRRSESSRGSTCSPVLLVDGQEIPGKRVYLAAPSGAKLLRERVLFEAAAPGREPVIDRYVVFDVAWEEPGEVVLDRKQSFVFAPGFLSPKALVAERILRAPTGQPKRDNASPTLPFIGRLPSPKELRTGKSDVERRFELAAMQELLGRSILSRSDALSRAIATRAGAVLYPRRSRIVAVSTGSIRTDCVNVEAYPVARPGQPAVTVRALRAAVAMTADAAQSEVLRKLTGRPSVSASSVLAAAEAQGIPVASYDRRNVASLNSSALPQAMKDRIRSAVASGRVVTLPERPVKLGHGDHFAGFSLDPLTGRVDPLTIIEGGIAFVEEFDRRMLAAEAIQASIMFGIGTYAAITVQEAVSDGEKWGADNQAPTDFFHIPLAELRALRCSVRLVGAFDSLYGLRDGVTSEDLFSFIFFELLDAIVTFPIEKLS